ncbi:uncharacterized protein LOC143040959 [Oratosquilla oratoria]|uniref:uncharacterized protein LOC143040959 n=1 Tax=Oratosquilla oratoria TaxID=337810 RepID=UPI003F764E8E
MDYRVKMKASCCLPADLLLSLLLLLPLLASPADSLLAESCSGKSHQVTLNPQAEAYIGVLLGASSRGEGLLGCGETHGVGVAEYEALRWAVGRANKNFGEIDKRIVTDSFVPGLKFGMHVYDTCEHDERATAGLGEMFPILREGSATCSPLSNDTLLALGVVDLTGVTERDRNVAPLLKKYGVPVANVAPDTIIPVEEKGKALLGFLSELKWKSTALLVADEAYSVGVANVVLEQAAAFNVCVSVMERIPGRIDDLRGGVADFADFAARRTPAVPANAIGSGLGGVGGGAGAAGPILKRPGLKYRKAVELVMAEGAVSGVVVLAKGDALRQVLLVLEEEPGRTRDLQWILNDLPEAELGLVRSLANSTKTVFVSSVSPLRISEFEDHWLGVQDPVTPVTQENEWVLHYLARIKGCRLPGAGPPESSSVEEEQRPCRSLDLEEDDLSVLARTRAVLPALHGAFSFFNAFRNTWKLKCRNRRGVCEDLRKVTREELVRDYLSPLQFRHDGPGSRSPPGLEGGKKRSDPMGKLSGATLALYKMTPGRSGVSVQEVLSFRNSTVTVTKQELLPWDTDCLVEECAPCLHLQDQKLEVAAMTSPLERLEEEFLLEPSDNRVYLAGLFPIHASSPDGSECGDSINAAAMQDLEAFLWAIDQINTHEKLLAGIQLGALVFDTCGSQVRALNHLTNLVSESLPGVLPAPDEVMAVVTSLDPKIARVTGEMLASLNVTSINLGSTPAQSPFALQMNPPMNEEAETIIQILRHLGWDYVSVVYTAGNDEAMEGAHSLRTLAEATGVCVAKEVAIQPGEEGEARDAYINDVLERLIEKSKSGARAVVMWTSKEDSLVLLRAVRRAILGHKMDKHDLVFVGSSMWGEHIEDIREFDPDLSAAVALKDGQQDVKDFIASYRLLQPGKNQRNPWFHKYWMQKFQCSNTAECTRLGGGFPVLPYAARPSTPRVIQGVFTFAAALTQLIDHLCPRAKGTICPGLPRWRFRIVLNEFIRNTEVSRVDKPAEFFQFTENFHGNAPLEIVNLRLERHNVYEYVKVGRYVNNALEMTGLVGEYHNGTRAPLGSMPSSCRSGCTDCNQHESDLVFIESPDKLYLMAAFNVHRKSDKPLECGPLDGDQGIQNVESMLWSLERINRDEEVLPGVKLGAIIFDACGSKEKVVRDVANFLSGRVPSRMKGKLPSSNNIVGFIAGGQGEEVRQLVDVTQPYSIPTLATLASDSAYANSHRFPVLLRLVPPNDARARAIVSLLLYWRWELFSVVYSDGGEGADVFKHLTREAHNFKIKPAVAEPVPLQELSVDYMLGVWGRLATAAQMGSRVIVLLLDAPHASSFLKAAQHLREEGVLSRGDFVYITLDASRQFLRAEKEVLGSINVRPVSGSVPKFEKYFRSLRVTNHTAYPWFHQFWEKVFQCSGATCFDEDSSAGRRDLKTYRYRQAEGVVNTANAVSLLAEGLERWRREACPGYTLGTCESLTEDEHYRDQVFHYTRAATLQGVDQRPIAFTLDGHNRAATLQVMNFRVLGPQRTGLLRVGFYSEQDGLVLNATQLMTYDTEGRGIPLSEVRSECINYEACAGTVNFVNSTEKKKTSFIQMYPNERFGISGLIPFHHQGKSFFSCGDYYGESVFQNLAGVSYALSQINNNNEGVGLGAIFFDYCGRTERARERMYSFFSGEAHENDKDILISPDRVVASVSFGDDAAEGVSNILSSNFIPHFSSPVGGHKLGDRKDDTILTSVPSRSAELRTILSLLDAFEWKYVSVLYDNDENGKFMVQTFRELSRQEDICIGDALGLPKRLSEEYAGEIVETIGVNWKPKVLVLLMDDSDNIQTLLKVADGLGYSEELVFVTGRAWGNKPSVPDGHDRISAGALTFTMETYDLPDFRVFLANLTLENHFPIPDEWFEEYFQNKFECRLSSSVRVQRHFVKECLGNEKIHADEIIQDPYVFHTILGVNAIALGLDSYIRKHCHSAETLDECHVVQAELLLEILAQSEISLNNTNDVNSYDQGGAYGYHIWNYRKLGNEYGYVNVGKWENSHLRLEIPSIEFKIGTYAPDSRCTEGPCLEVCSSQSAYYAAMTLPKPLPIDYNFRNVYGIVTSSLSLLGILLILITMVYFMMSFPTAAGTSILGYMILIGCIMVYSVNFAFIFQPTVGTCAVRRFLMGLGYAIMYSSMLIKVIYTWRVSATVLRPEGRDSPTRPTGLLLVAFALIMVQVILGAAWLILYPPNVDLEGQLWHCTPTETFEVELVVSLVYVMVLIAVTLVFCCETWNSDEPTKESRWIFLTALFTTLTWVVWTVVATRGPRHFRDPAIVIGNIVCASFVLIFLYVRKLYLYANLGKDAKEVEVRPHFAAVNNALYNAPSVSAHKFGGESTPRPPAMTPVGHVPGRQFVGDQEVSFRTVTLPPATPSSRPSPTPSSRRPSRTPSKRSLRLSLSDDIPEDFSLEVFESSEDEDEGAFTLEAHNLSDNEGEFGGRDRDIEANFGPSRRSFGSSSTVRQPSIRRVGSRQMLVFLTDGNSIGEVSRI